MQKSASLLSGGELEHSFWYEDAEEIVHSYAQHIEIAVEPIGRDYLLLHAPPDFRNRVLPVPCVARQEA